MTRHITALREFRQTDGLYVAVVEKARAMTDQRAATVDMPGSLERIARAADEARFQRHEVLTPLWEKRVLPGVVFNILVRRPLSVTRVEMLASSRGSEPLLLRATQNFFA